MSKSKEGLFLITLAISIFFMMFIASSDLYNINREVFDIPSNKSILISGSWRTGSTFLGQALSQINGSYYFFEPLRALHTKFEARKFKGKNEVMSEYNLQTSIRIMRSA